jgi:hypothetical protein
MLELSWVDHILSCRECYEGGELAIHYLNLILAEIVLDEGQGIN